MGEVERLGADFAAAAAWIAAQEPGIRFLAPMASARVRAAFERQRGCGVACECSSDSRCLDGQALTRGRSPPPME